MSKGFPHRKNNTGYGHLELRMSGLLDLGVFSKWSSPNNFPKKKKKKAGRLAAQTHPSP